MKQIIQDLKSGNTILEDVPAPLVQPGTVLIKTTKSLVSLGTERMLVEFGKANLVQKARQQPDKVKMVLDKIKTDGLQPTLEAVFSKLNQPLPLGYCNVGEVVKVGEGVDSFKIGDRVVSNGNHAEYVNVPQNLVAKIPDNVSDEEAAFTVIGAIGLQGIRLIAPTFGETVVVVGLGLIGLISAQLLKANGCRVIGFDYDQTKVDLANSFGIEAVNPGKGVDTVKHVQSLTSEVGADAVLITASNKSNDIISEAAQMSRKRGRIVLVGVIGLDISRADFYEKELTFQVSCSYGPGRYDDDYEQKGIDYPIAFVRWTEQRNFEAILAAISKQSIDVKSLITNEVELSDYLEIYQDMKGGAIASLINYGNSQPYSSTIAVAEADTFAGAKDSGFSVIGAGNFTNAMILPSLKKANAPLRYICSAGGLTAKSLAKKFEISNATSDYNDILKDEHTGMVLVTTRHNLHAQMVIDSLQAGKHVFVEKPLALKLEEIAKIEEAISATGKSVVVGYNRRFSPHMRAIRTAIGDADTPINVVATMNAGYIPENSWVHDLEVGGGRILGEACHYVDLITHLTKSKVKAVCASALGPNPSLNTDNVSFLLKMENGSNGVINYFANGSKSYSKERVEVFWQGKTMITDNFRKTEGFGVKGFKKLKTSQDKGHQHQFELLTRFLKEGGEPIIPQADTLHISKASILLLESLKTGGWVNVE